MQARKKIEARIRQLERKVAKLRKEIEEACSRTLKEVLYEELLPLLGEQAGLEWVLESDKPRARTQPTKTPEV